MPRHPGADKHGDVYEHRHIMESHLGRTLRPHEHVHHKNCKKDDNRLENLEVVNGSQHAVITHMEGRVRVLEDFIRANGLDVPREMSNFGH